MRKVLGIAGSVVVATAALSGGAALATQPYSPLPAAGGPFVEDGHKVTICHRTGSATNPYVVITVDVAAINGDKKNDHSHHDQVGNGLGGDVIPPVEGYNAGFNWDDNWTWEQAQAGEVTPALCVGSGGGGGGGNES